MELVWPGKYPQESGREVDVYWDSDLDTPIGKATLNTVGGRLRSKIEFFEMVIPPEVLKEVNNNPHVWAIYVSDNEILYMSAKLPEKRPLPPDVGSGGQNSGRKGVSNVGP